MRGDELLGHQVEAIAQGVIHITSAMAYQALTSSNGKLRKKNCSGVQPMRANRPLMRPYSLFDLPLQLVVDGHFLGRRYADRHQGDFAQQLRIFFQQTFVSVEFFQNAFGVVESAPPRGSV